VAKRYKVAPDELAQWNRINTGAAFKPGQTIVLHIADRTLRTLSPRATTVRKSAAAATKSAKIKTRNSRTAAASRTSKSTKVVRH
jgi:hypothetical protein